jgi:hypothetical protein
MAVDFPPLHLPHNVDVLGFLYILFRRDVFCFFTGLYLHYVAEVINVDENVCDRATMFVALTQKSILQILFRRVENPPIVFNVDGYTFTYEGFVGVDSFVWRVSRDNFEIAITFHGIDVEVHCDSKSNLDLIRFTWTYFERFTFVKYAMCIIRLDPVTDPCEATALYLQHPRHGRKDCEMPWVVKVASGGPTISCIRWQAA